MTGSSHRMDAPTAEAVDGEAVDGAGMAGDGVRGDGARGDGVRGDGVRGRIRHHLDDQAGLSAGAEALVFGFLVFVIGSIIALNGWAVLDAKFATNAAAREATRSIIEAGPATRPAMVGDNGSDMDAGRAYQVAVDTLAGHGKDPALLPDPEKFVVALLDDPWIGGHDRPDRCARVTVEVRYPVSPIRLPLVGGWTTPITVIGQHTELTDPLRSGLRGEATC